jgi:hypothetical protein
VNPAPFVHSALAMTRRLKRRDRCPLAWLLDVWRWHPNGHAGAGRRCLLLRVKRTCRASPDTSVFDPNPDLVTLLPMLVGLNGWQLAFTQLARRRLQAAPSSEQIPSSATFGRVAGSNVSVPDRTPQSNTAGPDHHWRLGYCAKMAGTPRQIRG